MRFFVVSASLIVQDAVTQAVTSDCSGAFVQRHVWLVGAQVEFAIADPRQVNAQLGSSLIMVVNELWAAIPSADTRNTNNAPDIPFIFHFHGDEDEL